MLLFFGYVFGSAVAMPGTEYRAFLVPGLLAATASGGIVTGMFQAAQDTHRGVTDRLRTLPVSRAAVPLGQAAADLVVTAAGLIPFLLVALAVGWRFEGTALDALAALTLLLLFRLACTWVGILLAPGRAWELRPIAEDEPPPPEPERWPSVCVLVPARNESDLLPSTLPALLAQDYPGEWRVAVVDDRSDDGTPQVARRLATGRVSVVDGAAPGAPTFTSSAVFCGAL